MANEDNANELIEQIRNVKPTVEHDDFVSVMREFNRMCASKNLCNGCPLLLSAKYEFGTKLAHCSADHMAFEDPEEFVEIVKKWSNEHHEMPCDAYNSGVCMSNGDKKCSCGGDTGICEIMTKKGGIDSVC